MMSQKLDEVVREFLIESFGAEQLDLRYPRLLQIAISGLKDLNKKSKKRVNFTRLEITDNDIAYLPSDYIKYTKVGLCKNGVLYALGYNNAMCPPDTDKCGDVDIKELSGSGEDDTFVLGGYSSLSSDYTEDGSYLGRNFGGIGGGNSEGYFKVFEEEGYIALQGVDADEIVLEYHSDIREIDGEHYVHYYDIEAIKAWMWWKYIQRNRSYPVNEKQLAKRDYERLRKEARMMHRALTVNEIINAVRRGYRPSPGV